MRTLRRLLGVRRCTIRAPIAKKECTEIHHTSTVRLKGVYGGALYGHHKRGEVYGGALPEHQGNCPEIKAPD